MKIRPVTKLIVAFRNFANAPKMRIHTHTHTYIYIYICILPTLRLIALSSRKKEFGARVENVHIYIYIYVCVCVCVCVCAHFLHARRILSYGMKARSDEVLEEYCWAITWRWKGHVEANRVPLSLTLLRTYILIYTYHTPRLIRRIFSRNPQKFTLCLNIGRCRLLNPH